VSFLMLMGGGLTGGKAAAGAESAVVNRPPARSRAY
jgi:hypothetical protein